MDVLDAPAFVPRLTRILGRKALGVLSDADRRDHRQAAKADGGKARAGAARSADGCCSSRWPERPTKSRQHQSPSFGAGTETHGAGLAGPCTAEPGAEVRAKVEAELDAT